MFIHRKLIALLIIIIVSCIGLMVLFAEDFFIKNEYIIKVNYCNSEKSDTISFTTKGSEERIHTYREAVPVLKIGEIADSHLGEKQILNVCSYEIISKKKID